jgi:hypothetical protein
MPASFPCSEYTAWRKAASALVADSPQGDPAWEQLGASNLIAWRFRQAWEKWESLKNFAVRTPNGGNHEDQYVTDDRMFGMLTAIVSCIESTTYSISAVASLSSVVGFSFATKAEQRNGSDPERLAKLIATSPKASALNAELTALANAAEWKLFVDLRNRVSHRSNLSRPGFAAVGAPLPPPIQFHFSATTSSPEIAMTLADFEAKLNWFTTTLRRMLVAALALL